MLRQNPHWLILVTCGAVYSIARPADIFRLRKTGRSLPQEQKQLMQATGHAKSANHDLRYMDLGGKVGHSLQIIRAMGLLHEVRETDRIRRQKGA